MDQSGWLLYRLQLVHVQYHFSKFDKAGIAALANPSGGPADPERARAYRNYTAGIFGHIWDDDGQPRIPALAARELLAASNAGRLPDWVFGLINIAEMRKAGES